MPYEAQMLGSLRMVLGGQMNIMCIPAKELHVYMHKAARVEDAAGERSPDGTLVYSFKAVSTFLSEMTQETVTQMSGKCQIYCGVVQDCSGSIGHMFHAFWSRLWNIYQPSIHIHTFFSHADYGDLPFNS